MGSVALKRIGRTAAIVLVVAGASSGVTYAATTRAPSYLACANSKGTLALLSRHNSCPHGYRKVRLGQTGPRGAAGQTGPRGAGGVAGPGAADLYAHTGAPHYTAASSQSTAAARAAVGVSVQSSCAANFGGAFLTVQNLNPAGSNVEVFGTAQASGDVTNGKPTATDSYGAHQLAAGGNGLTYSATGAGGTVTFAITESGGTHSIDLDFAVVNPAASKTANITARLVYGTDNCWSIAQVVV